MNSKFVVAQIQCFMFRKALQSDVQKPVRIFDAVLNTLIHIDCSNANTIIKAWISPAKICRTMVNAIAPLKGTCSFLQI